MKKSFICILAVLLLLAAAPMPASAQGFDPGTLESVVAVYCEFDYGSDRYGSIGTGFFVGKEGEEPQYLVTNYHVLEYYVDAGKSAGGGTLVAFFDSDTYEEVFVVDYDEEMDVAVLRLASPTSLRKPLKLRIPTEDMVGDPVYAIGYPTTSESVGSVSSFGINDATVTDGVISRVVVQSGSGRRVIHSTVTTHGGNSGGPLVDENGAVLGLNTFNYLDETGSVIDGSSYAVSVEELIPLLDSNHISYEMWAQQGSVPAMWIAIGAGAVVVLAAVIIAVAVSSSKKKQRLAQAQADAERRRRAEAEQLRRAAAEQRRPQRSPAVRSMAMQHSGLRVPLGTEPIIIGRNGATCKLVFRPDTPGVSKEHCSLRWDVQRSVFILTDLHSTYGTFLTNGEPLAPSQPYSLQPGDGFYLGDRVNELRVELG